MKVFRHQDVTQQSKIQSGTKVFQSLDEALLEWLRIKQTSAAISASRHEMEMVTFIIMVLLGHDLLLGRKSKGELPTKVSQIRPRLPETRFIQLLEDFPFADVQTTHVCATRPRELFRPLVLLLLLQPLLYYFVKRNENGKISLQNVRRALLQ